MHTLVVVLLALSALTLLLATLGLPRRPGQVAMFPLGALLFVLSVLLPVVFP